MGVLILPLCGRPPARRLFAACSTALVVACFYAVAAAGQTPSDSTGWVDPSPHTVRSVRVAPRVRLEVLDWGGAGEPLILLAGLGSTAHVFDDFATNFTDRSRVLAVTRRGFGASSKPESGYDRATLARDVRIVMDSLGIERAILVGHSFAGREITQFALDWPERVSGLVYLSALYLTRDLSEELEEESVPLSPSQRPSPPSKTDRASVRAFVEYLSRRSGVSIPEADVRAAFHIRADGSVGELVTPPRVYRQIGRHSLFGEHPLHRLSVPILAVSVEPRSLAAVVPNPRQLKPSERQQAQQRLRATERLQEAAWEPFERHPDARLATIPDADHSIFLSDEERVVEEVCAFLLEIIGS